MKFLAKRKILRLYEKCQGIDTLKEPRSEKFHAYDKDMLHYTPSNWKTLKRIHAIVRLDCNDIFIDFGSGKGKMVYLAAHYPLKKVIGIEISEPLHEIAQQNIANNMEQLKCKNIELVNKDVLEYSLPDDFTIAYLYNPFVNDLFIRVISKIENSFTKNPRKIWVIYKNPQMKDFLDNCSWLSFVGMYHNIAVYHSTPD